MDSIHIKLQRELALLASFIDGVANLRPKGEYIQTSLPYNCNFVEGLAIKDLNFRLGLSGFGFGKINDGLI